MALLGLKMALIHPKKVQIGYKLDQNTNLVNTFENNRRKCKKVKIQWNMEDFHWKISIRCWKSRFVKNHEKRNNSSPDSPIWLFFFFFFAENSRFFAEKWKYQNFDTEIYSTGCKDQHIQKWAKSDHLVMSCYVFRDFSQIAIFSMGCWFFSENPPYVTEFSLFCIFDYYFQKYSLNLYFGSIYSLFGPSLGEWEPFLAPKVPFFGHFYIFHWIFTFFCIFAYYFQKYKFVFWFNL